MKMSEQSRAEKKKKSMMMQQKIKYQTQNTQNTKMVYQRYI